MERIKRYEPTWRVGEMEEHTHGDWCKASDVTLLESELAATKRRLAVAERALEILKSDGKTAAFAVLAYAKAHREMEVGE